MLHRARVHRLQKEMLRSIFSRRMLSQQDFSFELEDRSGTNRIALQLSKEEQCLGDVSVEVFTTIKREHLLPWLLACPFETITETSSVTHLPRVGISEEVSSTKVYDSLIYIYQISRISVVSASFIT